MFLNRGMIEAAKTEAAMAGVMAHEILGAIVGGTAGSVIPPRLAVRPRHLLLEVRPRVRAAG